MRPALLVLPLLLVAPAACDEQSESVDAASFPVNACALIGEEIVSTWRLVEASHSTRNDALASSARCRMAGTFPADVLTLDLAVSAYGGGDSASADGFARKDLESRCDGLDAEAPGTLLREPDGCTTTRPDPGSRGKVMTVVATANDSHAVIRIDVAWSGEQRSSVEQTVDTLASGLASRAHSAWRDEEAGRR